MKEGKNFKSGPSEPTSVSLGTAGTGITATSYDDGRDIITVLTFTSLIIGQSATSANKAVGFLVYTFPAGTHLHVATYMDISLEHATATTGDLGIGSVVAAGAVAILSGTSTFEDYLTGQTTSTAPGGGAATKMMTAATAGPLTGISLNQAGSVKAVYLNFAALWPAFPPSDIYATGTITLKWCKMS